MIFITKSVLLTLALLLSVTSAPAFLFGRGAIGFIAKLESSADLRLTVAESRDPVRINNELIYTITVRNAGPDPARRVRLTETRPEGSVFISAIGSRGTCLNDLTTVCDFGDLGPNESADLTLTIRPSEIGTATNVASVTSETPDPNPGNNHVMTETRVTTLPSIAGRVVLGDGTALEGVSIALSGAQTATKVTGAGGFYQFADLEAGLNYTVTIALPGYVVRPPLQSFANLRQDATANFTATNCAFAITPVNRSFAASGGAGAIALSAADPLCPWEVRSNAEWIAISSEASGNGSAQVAFTVAPATKARSGTITLAGRTFTVYQEVDSCGTPDFTGARSIEAGRQPRAIVSADFNGDGKLDLAAVNEGSQVAILLGDGAGGFGAARLHPVGDDPVEMLVTDFNGDGRPDLVTANAGSSDLAVLLNDAQGSFKPATRVPLSRPPLALAIGDFNNVEEFKGDGAPDLVVSSKGPDPAVTILIGDGHGAFLAPKTFTVAQPYTSVAVADFNNDRDQDLVGANFTPGASGSELGLFLHLGNGDGTFGAARQFAEGVAATELFAYDFSGDGIADLAAPGPRELSLIFGDGRGNLTAPVRYPLVVRDPAEGQLRQLARGDFNSDGRPDLAISSLNVSFDVLLGDGAGGFGGPLSFDIGNHPGSVVAGDFDQDGRDDLALASSGGASTTGHLTLLLNACRPSGQVTTVSAADYIAKASPESIVAGFGEGLATTEEISSDLPLPTVLGGTSVSVRDSAGVERAAPLFAVAPGQVNYLIPAGTAEGGARVRVMSGDGRVSTGTILVTRHAPGIFTAERSGAGIAAALILRAKADGSRIYEPVARYDALQGRFIAVPIDFGDPTDELFLVLFGTGWRRVPGAPAAEVIAGGERIEVLYAGAQGDFVGLDQITARLPRALAGRGEVEVALTVEGVRANGVRIAFTAR